MRAEPDVPSRTAVCMTLLPPFLIGYSAAAALLALLGAKRRTIDRVYEGFARMCLRVAGTPLEVHGTEHVKPDQAYVIVPNHESNWDPVGLVAAFGGRPRFLIKREISNIPIFGHALRLTGNVVVDRTNTVADVARIRARMAERPIDVSILFYAEGTRSRDGSLRAFKKGAFATAIGYSLPILPVGHAGGYRIWKPLGWRIRRLPMVVMIGEPIPVDSLQMKDREELRLRTHEIVADLRGRARTRLRELGYEPGGID